MIKKEYQTSQDTKWNMSEHFLKSLVQKHEMFSLCLRRRDVESMYFAITDEYIYVFPYIKEYKETPILNKLLEKTRNELYKTYPEGDHFDKEKNIMRTRVLHILIECKKNLQLLEARKGLLLEKIPDPEKKRRKYGH